MIAIDGQLEIDAERGVIYFNTNDSAWAELYGGQCVLRIQGLPAPIPVPIPGRVLLWPRDPNRKPKPADVPAGDES